MSSTDVKHASAGADYVLVAKSDGYFLHAPMVSSHADSPVFGC